MPQHSASSSSRRFHYSLFDYDAKDYCPPFFQENSSSFIASQNLKNDPPPPPPLPPSSSSSTQETEHVKYSIETSESSQVICEICVETKRTTQMINNKTCDQSYFSDCVTKHVATKIQDSITVVPCPGLGCKSVFVLEDWLPWLPKDLLERWDKALCDALFLQVPKCYCPFKDCSAMMLVENEKDQQTAGETECPVCQRMFCPRCNVSWHTGVDCKKYRKLRIRDKGKIGL